MITARQSRAARALLGWTQETLADKAQVALTALKRLESQSGLEVFESTRDQVRRALEAFSNTQFTDFDPFKAAYADLSAKLRPQVFQLGFLLS